MHARVQGCAAGCSLWALYNHMPATPACRAMREQLQHAASIQCGGCYMLAAPRHPAPHPPVASACLKVAARCCVRLAYSTCGVGTGNKPDRVSGKRPPPCVLFNVYKASVFVFAATPSAHACRVLPHSCAASAWRQVQLLRAHRVVASRQAHTAWPGTANMRNGGW